MVGERVIGSRIRERRLDQGLRQADVAETVGISASYLNLIEHNKRRIGGKLLSQLADVLETDAATLASGADAAILDGMRAAAARFPQNVEIARAEDLAARYPGWASLIAALEVRTTALESEVQALTDRIAHDPALAGALHNVITAVTSIRATAGILVSGDRIDEDWQQRFHVNIHDDSRKLADESKALVSYLDQPKSSTHKSAPMSVFDQAEAFFAETPDLMAAIEASPEAPALGLLTSFEKVRLDRDARVLVLRHIERMKADVQALPKNTFDAAALGALGDPTKLAAQFDVPLPVVFRRLAYLPSDVGLPPMGLAICDAAGALTTIKSVAGFGLHRRATSCPLWPLFAALGQPMRPIKTEVILPDPGETRFLCFAVATTKPLATFNVAPQVESTMLVAADPDPGHGDPLLVGSSCRICPRSDCAARREPSVIEGFV